MSKWTAKDQTWQDEATRYRRFMVQVQAYILWRARAHDIDQHTAVRMVGEWASTTDELLPSIPRPSIYGPAKPDGNW